MARYRMKVANKLAEMLIDVADDKFVETVIKANKLTDTPLVRAQLTVLGARPDSHCGLCKRAVLRA